MRRVQVLACIVLAWCVEAHAQSTTGDAQSYKIWQQQQIEREKKQRAEQAPPTPRSSVGTTQPPAGSSAPFALPPYTPTEDDRRRSGDLQQFAGLAAERLAENPPNCRALIELGSAYSRGIENVAIDTIGTTTTQSDVACANLCADSMELKGRLCESSRIPDTEVATLRDAWYRPGKIVAEHSGYSNSFGDGPGRAFYPRWHGNDCPCTAYVGPVQAQLMKEWTRARKLLGPH